MKVKKIILTLSLLLGASAAVAAIECGHIGPAAAVPAADAPLSVIPRVVVTATKAQVVEAPVTRIVVIGHRVDPSQVVQKSSRSAPGA